MMKIDVVNEKDNKFFKRKDLSLKLEHSTVATPSKDELSEQLAKDRSVDKTQVVVDYISTKKGSHESVASVKILDEKPPVKEEPKKEGDAPAEEKKEESQ